MKVLIVVDSSSKTEVLIIEKWWIGEEFTQNGG
jgi:hypothetical protein